MSYEKVLGTKAYIAKVIDTGELTLDDWGICYIVDGEGSANDDLATITGGVEGQPIIIKADGITITLKHGVDNISLTSGSDVALTTGMQILLVLNDDGNWEDFLNVATPDLHKTSHENGGADEISLAGLSGEPADTVNKTLFNAQTVLAATADDTPAAVTINEQHLVGRLTGGNVGEVDIGIGDDDILQVDGTLEDNDFCYATASGVEGKTAAETEALLTGLLPKQMVENDPILMDEAMSGDEKYCGFCRAGVAGATLAVGDVCYYSSGDDRWELADADSAATAQGALGVCVLAAGNNGDPTRMLLWGFVRSAAFPSFTKGAPVFLSATDGDLTNTAPAGTGDIIRCVGQAWSAEDLFWNPSPDWFEHA